MGRLLINLSILFLLTYVTGCAHTHTTISVNVKDRGERIRTKYKYKIGYWFNADEIVQLDEDRWVVDDKMMKDLKKWQPDVFDVNGIPVTSEISSSKLTLNLYYSPSRERRIYGYPIMPFLSALSCWIIPQAETLHSNEKWTFRVNGHSVQKVSVEACIHADSAGGILLPFPWLLFWWNTDTCYSDKRTFDSHVTSTVSTIIDSEVAMRALAYGLAVKLKELEDSGKIGDDLAVNAIASQETTAGWLSATPFEIVRCENTTGKDFEYDFTLKNKGGVAPKLSDYERIRSAFRAAIVNTYCMKHPKANPRSVVTDFTRYTMRGEYITGRVSVLTIDVTTVFYDAATRTGRMSARIAANQFEDVRMFIRNHIEELAARSNIVFDGDALPPGARYYTGDERLTGDGVLEVEFKTE